MSSSPPIEFTLYLLEDQPAPHHASPAPPSRLRGPARPHPPPPTMVRTSASVSTPKLCLHLHLYGDVVLPPSSPARRKAQNKLKTKHNF
jgi:hypothetical protein